MIRAVVQLAHGLLARLKTVDGADSGLDADLLDGQHASEFAGAVHTHDGVYSPVGHDHDADYAAISHDHDGVYAALSHTHAISDITDLTTTLSGKASASDLSSHTGNTSNPHSVTAEQVGAYTDDEVDSLLEGYSPTSHDHDGVYSPVGHDHDADYAAIGHTHDSRYYTETEVDSLLEGYAEADHDHDEDYAPASHVTTASGVHGVTGDVVGTTDTQTLTNKTLQGTTYVSTSGGIGILSFEAATSNAVALLFGNDTNLYRSAANVLKTDDGFSASALTSTSGTIYLGDNNLLSVSGNKVTLDGTFACTNAGDYFTVDLDSSPVIELNVGINSLLSITSLGEMTVLGTITSAGNTVETQNNKNQVSGYAGLDASGELDAGVLPAHEHTLPTGTAAEIAEATATLGRMALATDTGELFIADGSVWRYPAYRPKLLRAGIGEVGPTYQIDADRDVFVLAQENTGGTLTVTLPAPSADLLGMQITIRAITDTVNEGTVLITSSSDIAVPETFTGSGSNQHRLELSEDDIQITDGVAELTFRCVIDDYSDENLSDHYWEVSAWHRYDGVIAMV